MFLQYCLNMGLARKWLKLIGSRKQISTIGTETAAAEKHSRRKLWNSFRLTNRKSSLVREKKGVGDNWKTNVAQEERAAICIQTAFRGFLAKRALRALKGLVRLQSAINGHDSRKQSAASLHCIQAFVRVQARIRRERAIQTRDALGLPQQELACSTVETCTTVSEIEWCNALGSVEEIRAKEQRKQAAAINRDRAIAYAFCNKWKANVKVNPGSLFDYDLDNSTWSWIWLDKWVNGQPTKEHVNNKQGSQRVTNEDSARRKLVPKKAGAVGIRSYLTSKVSPDKSKETKKALKREVSPGRILKARAGRGKGITVLALKPHVKLQPGRPLSQSKQQPNKDLKKQVSVHNSK